VRAKGIHVAGLTWRCGAHALPLTRALVMGIVNVTPDSFSDGGVNFDPRAAFVAAWAMSAAGADLIDVGGESTRPGSGEVAPAEELARVLPVVRDLAARGAVVSVDTRHATVASECVKAGAAVINDISGFSDPAMVALAASCDAGLVVMHMQGDPGTMQDEPHYGDVVAEVSAYLLGQAASLEAAGVARERIALDPGIGFGKTTAHNLELLRRLDDIVALGYPVLVGASRKRFIGEITGVTEPRDRLAGSVAAALVAVEHGAAIVRVHDVAETVQALAIAQAVRGGTEEQ
jgi:dihydropteroate synthase